MEQILEVSLTVNVWGTEHVLLSFDRSYLLQKYGKEGVCMKIFSSNFRAEIDVYLFVLFKLITEL